MSSDAPTTVIFNTTAAGACIDEPGHLLGGGEWAAIRPDRTTRAQLAAGILVEVDDPGGDVPGPAGVAFTATRGRPSRTAASPPDKDAKSPGPRKPTED